MRRGYTAPHESKDLTGPQTMRIRGREEEWRCNLPQMGEIPPTSTTHTPGPAAVQHVEGPRAVGRTWLVLAQLHEAGRGVGQERR